MAISGFTEMFSDGSKVGKLVINTGTITEYPTPTPGSSPRGITSAPDGNLWFAEKFGNNIGKITTSGTITEFPVPTPSSGPFEITSGPDSRHWFTELSANQIGVLRAK